MILNNPMSGVRLHRSGREFSLKRRFLGAGLLLVNRDTKEIGLSKAWSARGPGIVALRFSQVRYFLARIGRYSRLMITRRNSSKKERWVVLPVGCTMFL